MDSDRSQSPRGESGKASESRSPSPEAKPELAASMEDVKMSRTPTPSRSPSKSSRRSPTRSRSRSWRSDEKRGGCETEVLKISDDDASFILGAGGRTKRKLSRVCGAELNVKDQDGSTVLEIKGSKEARERGHLYVSYVMQQRVGPVSLNCEPESRNDLSIIEVPHECVGYVTGKKGQGLRSIEEEWCTLMFFTDLRSKSEGETERLAIFGATDWNRKGARLKVMSAVEQKKPGYFTEGVMEAVSEENGFDIDTLPISEDNYSYALGKKGLTRKKLARASGAILEYVGKIAHIGGNKVQRTRAREYLEWLCSQRTSYVHVQTEGRVDCTVINVPTPCIAYVTGTKGTVLRSIEDSTGTFIFLDGKNSKNTSDEQRELTEFERLLIFGHEEAERERAKQQIKDRIESKQNGHPHRHHRRSYSRSPSRDRYRRRPGNQRYSALPHRRSYSRSQSPKRFDRHYRQHEIPHYSRNNNYGRQPEPYRGRRPSPPRARSRSRSYERRRDFRRSPPPHSRRY